MKINDGYRSNYDLVLKNISKQKGRKIMGIEQNTRNYGFDVLKKYKVIRKKNDGY